MAPSTQARRPGRVSCSMASTLLRYTRAVRGEPGVAELLDLAAVGISAATLADAGNWMTHDEAIALLDAAARLFDDPLIGRKVGEATVGAQAGSSVATALRSLGSPEAVYEYQATLATKFSTVTELVTREVEPGRAVIEARPRPGFSRDGHFCNWTTGLLTQPPTLFGLPVARVVEHSCAARGSESCVYEVSWESKPDTGTDPAQRADRLEAQLEGMTLRLESMYATARDLISIEDLDQALGRITERAATAVRAPHYLLAARTGAGGALRVHQRGWESDDLEETAARLLSGEIEPSESRLIAEVETSNHHYGRLMASAQGAGFFPGERESFEVYARFAASVLETATALGEARRAQEVSEALLGLSQDLSQINDLAALARRLVETIPEIVDCDRTGVFLWDEDAGALSCAAFTEFVGDAAEELRAVRVGPADTPALAALLREQSREPLLFQRGTTDPFLSELMRRIGSTATVIVPVISRGRLHGILTLGAIDRPERLDRSPELDAKLTGIAGQAATAFDNAKLIEGISRQARQDGLTGMLGHRAFHETLLEMLAEDGEAARFALAMIDLDDFKLVNDSHGHPVGDQALCLIADALAESVREEDLAFRIGGEEFALILPRRTLEEALPVVERVREAVERLSFVAPLRVSIGLAAAPESAT